MEDLYELTGFNHIGKNENKTLIILSDTRRECKNYINSLKYRYNNKNPYFLKRTSGEYHTKNLSFYQIIY
jgi:hypothetical protein